MNMDEELDSNAKTATPVEVEVTSNPEPSELELQREHETQEEQPQTTGESSDISFSHSNIEASSAPPLQLLNETETCAEMPEAILDESSEKINEELSEPPLSVNIEDQLKEFDGSDDEGISNKEAHEPIENLVDALCDSESSKPENEAVESFEVHSDAEDDTSRNANDGKDIFEEVDMSLVEKERTTTSEENDVLADDRTRPTGVDEKCDQTEDEESRTGSRMEVDHEEHEEDGHEEHIVDDQSHDYHHQSEHEDGDDDHRDADEEDGSRQDIEDDSTRHNETEEDGRTTATTERITPNNEEDEEENEKGKNITSVEGTDQSETVKNGDNEHAGSDQLNCADTEATKSTKDEIQGETADVNLTDDNKETQNKKGRVSAKTGNPEENQEKHEIDKSDNAVSVTPGRTTRGRDAQTKANSGKTSSDQDVSANQDEAKSRIKTRISRKESPEIALENNKDKSAATEIKTRKKARGMDGSNDRATPDNTSNRSKVVEEGEEAEAAESAENLELKELQIKELTDDLPDEKCARCRKNRPCQYKYMKNGEIRYLCCLKCLHAFRTISKDVFHLIARKIAISLVFDVQQTCQACKSRKICRYRLKRPENETQFIFLCEPKCYDSFVGMNVEKFFKRRKVYLVQEVPAEISEVEKKCIKCFHMKKCLYSFRDDENVTHFICDDACFNELEKEEQNRLKLKRRSVRVRDLGIPPDIPTHAIIQQQPQPQSSTPEPRNLTRTEEEAEQARFDREASLVRRCGECLQIMTSARNILEWETLPFCSDACLEKYQHVIGSNCTNCKSLVSSTSMGKYCVRFGFEVRQFCSSHCLDTYKKKNLKECAHCQRDISHDKDGFLAPVGDKSQFKDFCSKACVKKYEDLLNPRKKQNTGICAVCNLDKLVRVDLFLDQRSFEFCSNPCFSAFKFVNNISPDQCSLCLKYFERKSTNAFTLYEDNAPKMFCSRICLTVFISVNRKIVSCQWCKVKKYNFDMILRNNAGLTTTLCSITCLRKYLGPGSINAGSSALVVRLQKICDQCHSNCNPTFSLAMSDSTSRNFCTQQCVIDFQALHKRPVNETVKSVGQKRLSPYPIGLPKKLQPKADKSIIRPVQLGQHSPQQNTTTSAAAATPSVSSPQPQPTANTAPVSVPSPPPTTPSPAPPSTDAPSPDFSLPTIKKRGRPKKNIEVNVYDTDTSVATAPSPPAIRPVKKRSFGTNTAEMGGLKSQIITVPPPQPQMVNKMVMCTPSAAALAMQARRPTCTVELQTEDSLEKKYCVPIPVPIYVPQPMHMYSMPFPVPVPIPLPIPVPIFIPTTRNTAAGIMKEIKKIQDKMPADPFEAELLMMAELVADEKRNESDSEPEEAAEDTSVVEYAPEGDDIFQMDLNISTGYEEQPNVDIETSMPANAIQQVTPTLDGVNDYMTQQQQMMMMEPQRRLMSNVNTPRKRTVSPPAARGRLSTTPPQKRSRPSQPPQQQQIITPPAAEPIRQTTEPAERPDANMCLKYTFGVNAWRQWVMNKNADIEKSTLRRKPFKTELLQLTADELNYSLCLFVKEVRKPNGSEYAPDTIYYLVLGIQQYLYENGRIDNIFTDPYYERFTDCLDEVARKFSILYNDSQYIVTRVEEEHLWECKQLGAHSPHVLLSTLMFFNTKHFNLTTVDEHMQLSFSHIMKHWKRNPAGKQNQSTRNVLLRFYPPQTTPDNPRKKKVYEQQENENNPLRCPVKLYEFYLSKCPESVKTRSDVFYLQPERSCVPDSPVWYSTQPLSREALNKMLHRVKMVKEINVALLSSQ